MSYKSLSKEELVSTLRSFKKEGEFWDFKQRWHTDINDLIKDIFCFVNTVHDMDCYLIFGINDNFEVIGVLEGEERKLSDIEDKISCLKIVGDVKIRLSLDSVKLEEKRVDVLTIHNINSTPVMLSTNNGKMLANCVYCRVNDRNTPNKGNASISEIENLWKKRLGLTKPAMDFIFDHMEDKFDWIENNNQYFYIYRPEYLIEIQDKDINKTPFYAYSCQGGNSLNKEIEIKAYGTTLRSFPLITLDSGVLTVPKPDWKFLPLDRVTSEYVNYYYYIEESETYKVLNFLYDEFDMAQKIALIDIFRVIPVFKSDDEFVKFNHYLITIKKKLLEKVDNSDEFNWVHTGDLARDSEIQMQLRMGSEIVKLLKETRNCNLLKI